MATDSLGEGEEMIGVYIYGLVPVFIFLISMIIKMDYQQKSTDFTVLDAFMDTQMAIILTALWPLLLIALVIITVFEWMDSVVLFKGKKK